MSAVSPGRGQAPLNFKGKRPGNEVGGVSEQNVKPRPQNRILVSLRVFFKTFPKSTPVSFSYGSSPRDREYSPRSKFQINLSRVNAPEI